MSTTPDATTPAPEELPFVAAGKDVLYNGNIFMWCKNPKEATLAAQCLNGVSADDRKRIRDLEEALEMRERRLSLIEQSMKQLVDFIRFLRSPITADIVRKMREQAPTDDASPDVVNEPPVADASSDADAPTVAEASPVVPEASPVPERKQHWWIKIRKKEDRYATASYQVRKRPEWHDRVISFVHERDKCKYHFSADVYEITVSHLYDDECGLPDKRNEWDYTTTSD